MKITAIETNVCHARIRNWIFVKVVTDQPGLYGWGEATLEWHTRGVVGAIEDLVAMTGDMEAFDERFSTLQAGLVKRAALRGDYDHVPLEVRFYKGDFFYRALLCFVFSFLFCASSWLLPRSVWVVRGIWATLLGGTGLLVLGIVLRCIIRQRPPVSTLYETILFITAICVIVAIAIEAMNRQRIAQVVAAFLGAAGMFLSMKYELKELGSFETELYEFVEARYSALLEKIRNSGEFNDEIKAEMTKAITEFDEAFQAKRAAA